MPDWNALPEKMLRLKALERATQKQEATGMTHDPRPMILIHEQGDLDCYTFAWLWLRFGPERFREAEVRFTNLAKPDKQLITRATVVGDMGGNYVPEAGWFDHHQDASLPCATQLAWEWLNHTVTGSRLAGDLDYLWPLIELIDNYNRGQPLQPAIKFTNEFGPHALLSGYRLICHEQGESSSDDDALRFVCRTLDFIAENLKHQYDAWWAVQYHTVYISDDRQLIALYDCNKAVCFAACEQDYKLVAFHNQETQPNGEVWHHVGLMCNQGNDAVRCDDLVTNTQLWLKTGDSLRPEADLIYDEFETWYLDKRGFFAGRSAKGNQHQPPLVPIEEIAKVLDAAWQR